MTPEEIGELVAAICAIPEKRLEELKAMEEDFHRLVVKEALKLNSINSVTQEQRAISKKTLFAYLYKMGRTDISKMLGGS